MNSNFVEDEKKFNKETAHIPLFASGGRDFSRQYLGYLIGSLSLIEDRFSSEAENWFSIVKAYELDQVSQNEIAEVRRKIIERRKIEYNLDFFDDDLQDENDAISFFLYVALHPKDFHQAPTEIMRMIDLFSGDFIRFFGYGPELVAVLKRAFGI